ncbi:MAG: hypothetical protein M1831_001018 [Alyxoria varia]|nr:MAG: hypothetical protein M1831_001018 [Alyxoria varia]
MSCGANPALVPGPEKRCRECRAIRAGWMFISIRETRVDIASCVSCRVEKYLHHDKQMPPKVEGRGLTTEEIKQKEESRLRHYMINRRTYNEVPEDAEGQLLQRLHASSAWTREYNSTGPSIQSAIQVDTSGSDSDSKLLNVQMGMLSARLRKVAAETGELYKEHEPLAATTNYPKVVFDDIIAALDQFDKAIHKSDGAKTFSICPEDAVGHGQSATPASTSKGNAGGQDIVDLTGDQ